MSSAFFTRFICVIPKLCVLPAISIHRIVTTRTASRPNQNAPKRQR